MTKNPFQKQSQRATRKIKVELPPKEDKPATTVSDEPETNQNQPDKPKQVKEIKADPAINKTNSEEKTNPSLTETAEKIIGPKPINLRVTQTFQYALQDAIRDQVRKRKTLNKDYNQTICLAEAIVLWFKHYGYELPLEDEE